MNRIALVLLTATCTLLGQDAKAIVTEVQQRARVDSEQYEGLLQVTDSAGKVSEKSWTYERVGSHGNSRSLIRFKSPANVKGVALLIINHPDRASEQWMWTPNLHRERRIALQDRITRFFGTDFSFEDLDERDLENFDYSYKGEEVIDGEVCWKIESKPKPVRRSQYTSSVLWIRKSNYTYAQIENYSGGKLVRQLKYNDMVKVQGIWTARLLVMQDFRRKSHTTLKLDSTRYNSAIPEERFTLQALRRQQ